MSTVLMFLLKWPSMAPNPLIETPSFTQFLSLTVTRKETSKNIFRIGVLTEDDQIKAKKCISHSNIQRITSTTINDSVKAI